MKTKPLIIASVILMGVGVYLVSDYYQNVVYSLDLSREQLQGIFATSEPQTISNHLESIKEYLPEEGNPVWIFPTETTNFARMQSDLDVMITSTDKISSIPSDTSAFHTGILDVHERSNILYENLNDARTFLYVSIANFLFNLIWLLGVFGFHEALMRRTY